MINQVYQLVAPRQFEITYNNESITDNKVVIRPLYLSIKNVYLIEIIYMYLIVTWYNYLM